MVKLMAACGVGLGQLNGVINLGCCICAGVKALLSCYCQVQKARLCFIDFEYIVQFYTVRALWLI